MSYPLWQYLRMMMNDNNKMNKEQFKNEVLALVSEDALPMVDALTEQGFAEGWTPEGEYAKQLAVHLRSLNRAHFGYADHYCHVKQNPYWIKGEKTIIVIENHKFYKLR